jgi:hypothetical protein
LPLMRSRNSDVGAEATWSWASPDLCVGWQQLEEPGIISTFALAYIYATGGYTGCQGWPADRIRHGAACVPANRAKFPPATCFRLLRSASALPQRRREHSLFLIRWRAGMIRTHNFAFRGVTLQPSRGSSGRPPQRSSGAPPVAKNRVINSGYCDVADLRYQFCDIARFCTLRQAIAPGRSALSV